METEILIDGKKVKFRATAAVPRLYRIKFRRDIIQDMATVKKALESKEKGASSLPLEALLGGEIRLLMHFLGPEFSVDCQAGQGYI